MPGRLRRSGSQFHLSGVSIDAVQHKEKSARELRVSGRAWGWEERLVDSAASSFHVCATVVDRDTVSRFAGAFGDDLRRAISAVVLHDFRDGMGRAFGACIHNAGPSVGAFGAFLGDWSGGLDFGRGRAFGQSHQSLSAFFCIGSGSKSESESTHAGNQERFAIRCFHIRFFLFCFSVSGGLSAHAYTTPAPRKTREEKG